MSKEDKTIRVEVKTRAFTGGRRVYPGQKILIPEGQFNPTVFKKVVGIKEIPEGEVLDIPEVEPAPNEKKTERTNKNVI